jgi:hypothetical protein
MAPPNSLSKPLLQNRQAFLVDVVLLVWLYIYIENFMLYSEEE